MPHGPGKIRIFEKMAKNQGGTLAKTQGSPLGFWHFFQFSAIFSDFEQSSTSTCPKELKFDMQI